MRCGEVDYPKSLESPPQSLNFEKMFETKYHNDTRRLHSTHNIYYNLTNWKSLHELYRAREQITLVEKQLQLRRLEEEKKLFRTFNNKSSSPNRSNSNDKSLQIIIITWSPAPRNRSLFFGRSSMVRYRLRLHTYGGNAQNYGYFHGLMEWTGSSRLNPNYNYTVWHTELHSRSIWNDTFYWIEHRAWCGCNWIISRFEIILKLRKSVPISKQINLIRSDDQLFNNLILKRLLIAHAEVASEQFIFNPFAADEISARRSFSVCNIRFAPVAVHRIRLASDWATFGILKHQITQDIKNQSEMDWNWKLIERIKFFVPWKMDEKWRMCVFRRIPRTSIRKGTKQIITIIWTWW